MKLHLLPIAGALAAGLSFVSPLMAASPAAESIKNLNTAYQGESNAAHRYGKFAAAAEREGFPQVAKLFRAASEAEGIHRDTHKEAIEKLGGRVETFQLDVVEVKSTAENLKAAIQGEAYERDSMYPEFLAAAKKEDARDAIRSFQFAATAEAEHAKLYQNALNNLGKNAPEDYYVCQICGMTLTELPARKCPSCRKGVDNYKKIS